MPLPTTTWISSAGTKIRRPTPMMPRALSASTCKACMLSAASEMAARERFAVARAFSSTLVPLEEPERGLLFSGVVILLSY